MKENEINSTTVENINEGFSEYLKGQNIKAFYEFDKFEFMDPENGELGLGENNILVVEREIEGKDGEKITVYDFYKDGVQIANTNENGEIEFSDEYIKMLKSTNKDYYNALHMDKRNPKTVTKEDLEKKLQEEEQSRDDVDQDKDNKSKEKNEKKQEEPEIDEKDKDNKEAIKKALGDKYQSVSEINDKEVSDEFSRKEGFIGNPFMAYNAETKEFVIIGYNQNGKLVESKMLQTKAWVNVDKYEKSDQMRETTINGLMFISSQDKDALSIEVNNYGEMKINKVINARTEHPQVLPVDTKQTVPSNKEIDEMKKNPEVMDEIQSELDDAVENGILTNDEAVAFEEKMANDGKDSEENLEELRALKEAKQKEQEQEENEIVDDDDGAPPMADPFNPNNRSRW